MKKKLYSILLVALSCVSIAGIGLATSTIKIGYAEEAMVNIEIEDEEQFLSMMNGQSGLLKSQSVHKATYDELYSITNLKPTVYRAVTTTYAYPTPFPNGTRVTGIPAGTDVLVTGFCPITGWYRISVNGTDAFVSNNRFIDLPNMTAQNVSALVVSPFYRGFTELVETDKGVLFVPANMYIPAISSHDLGTINITLVNALRKQNGLRALATGNAQALADTRSLELNTSYSHVRANGTTVANIGYGENITGVAEPINNFITWYLSDGHRANMLNAGYTQMNYSASGSKNGSRAVQLFK